MEVWGQLCEPLLFSFMWVWEAESHGRFMQQAPLLPKLLLTLDISPEHTHTYV